MKDVTRHCQGFCRKFFLRLRCSVLWTQSSSESGKLLECWDSLLTELPLADHVCGLNPSQCCCRRMEGFEAEHWSCNSFDETMILFHDIVEVFRLDNADDPAHPREFEDNVDALQTSEIGAALVDHNAFRDTVGANGAFEKPSGGSRIAVLSQHKFKGLAGFVA